MDEKEYMRRALAAYFRTGGTEQPEAGKSSVLESGGLWYVILRNSTDVLAVYRITNEEQLRRMKRPPRELIEA